MILTELDAADNKEQLLEEIRSCGWNAGPFLYKLFHDGKIKDLLGESTKVFVLTDGDKLVSFCTLSEKDDIQPTELTPWIGFVFTSPEYRGRHCAGKLIRRAEQEAAAMGFDRTYISTDHTGLYEKYGYTFLCEMNDVHGNLSRVYTRQL